MDKEVVRKLFPELKDEDIEEVILNLQQFLSVIADVANKPTETIEYGKE